MLNEKPVLGMVADFSHNCPVGAYARNITESLTKNFNVELLDLRSSELLYCQSTRSPTLMESNFKSLLKRMEKIDLINIHLEFGLFGDGFDAVMNRVMNICNLVKNIVITVHSVHMNSPDFADFYRSLYDKIKRLSNTKNILIVVNNKRDQFVIENDFGLKNTIKFPIVYFGKKEIEKYSKTNVLREPSLIKDRIHFDITDQDYIIGSFGFFQPHKDLLTVLKCLAWLPKNYKLIIAGKQHPSSRRHMEKDPVVVELLDFIETHDKWQLASSQKEPTLLSDRIAFLDNLSDEQFFSTFASVDFVALNYLETQMSASAVMSQALQLQKKIIATNCTTFDYLADFFTDCFERIDFGNYIQMRQKILSFSAEKVQNLKNCAEKWNADELSKIYLNFFQKNEYLSVDNISTDQSQIYNTSNNAQTKQIFNLASYINMSKLSKSIRNPGAGTLLGKNMLVQKGKGVANGNPPNVSLNVKDAKNLQFIVESECVAGPAMHWSLRYQHNGDISALRKKKIVATVRLKANEFHHIGGMYLKIYDGHLDTHIPIKQLNCTEEDISLHHTVSDQADRLFLDFVLAEGEIANLPRGAIIDVLDMNLVEE